MSNRGRRQGVGRPGAGLEVYGAGNKGAILVDEPEESAAPKPPGGKTAEQKPWWKFW